YLVDSVIVTEYICTQQTGSFQCFSHCISSNYSIGSCQSHVAVTCSFDIYAKYLTSGSRSQCALDEDSHGALDNCSHCAGDEQNYYRSSRSSVFIQCPRIIDYSLLVLL
uniref:Uncharacterized protein n=1 Tax=Amphimedon queenslandica TaxID=400682 RepID=A0A1X7TQ51_AMPQE